MSKHKRAVSSPTAIADMSPTPISPPRKEIAHLLLLGCLTLLVIFIFSYTVSLRRPWFGVLAVSPGDHHQWLTGSTLKFARNWYREGAFHLRFLMLENPRSVEFPTLNSRGMYVSYPPGTILPIYALSLLTGKEPSVPLIMGYDLANQLMLALVLAFTVYAALIRLLHRWYVVLFAAIPPLCVLLLPAPLYWFQNVYFSDQAIVLPYALLLLTEVWRDGTLTVRQRRLLDVLQGVILCFGFLTDWLFVFLSLVVFGKRLLLGQLGRPWRVWLTRSLAFWAGPALALGLFVWQLTAYQCWGLLWARYFLRTGISAEGAMHTSHFFAQYWLGFISAGYGGVAVFLLWGSLIAWCIALLLHWRTRKTTEGHYASETQLVSLMGMALLPNFLEIYFFKNHSWVHEFAALKMVIPLSLVPFVLLPVWLLLVTKQLPALRGQLARPKPLVPVCTVLLLGITLAYTLHEHPRYYTFFPPPTWALPKLAEFFAAHYQYNDIVFSRDFAIPTNPPQLLGYTMKRVYRYSSQADIDRITAGIREPFHIVPFSFKR